MIEVREECVADVAAIGSVTERAFGQRQEAGLIEQLRRQGAVSLSLVAESDGAVVGHILFSPVTVHQQGFEGSVVGLAPMAVVPELQRTGIGSQLVRAGLEIVRERGHDAVVVLGHPEYYPRFGFVPAHAFGLSCEYPVPSEVFMALELEGGALDGVEGRVTYHEAFDSV